MTRAADPHDGQAGRRPVPGPGGRVLPCPPDSLFDGFPSSGGPWLPARPFIMRSRTFAHFGEVTARAARLVLACCARRAGTAGELREALGLPPGHVPMLDPDEPLGDHLLAAVRPDIVTQAGVPRLVELNIDGAVGGAPHVDFLASRFLAFYDGESAASDLRPAPGALDLRSRALRSLPGLEAGAHMVIPAFSAGTAPGTEDTARFIRWQQPACESARRHGLTMTVFPLDRLTADSECRLRAGGRPVDGVLRLFDSFSQPRSEGLDALIRAVRARTVQMFTPEATILLTSKMTFAWLWEDAGGLPPADRDFVRRHIPWTVPVREACLDDAAARQDSLVLKPADGYGGTGVVVGAAVPAGQWRRALAAAAAAGGHLLQEYVAGDTVTLGFTHARTGERRAGPVRFVAGPLLFGGEQAGVLIRHGVPGNGAGPVLNAQLGAQVNTALLTEDGAADL
jgi:hypothetical protein